MTRDELERMTRRQVVAYALQQQAMATESRDRLARHRTRTTGLIGEVQSLRSQLDQAKILLGRLIIREEIAQ